MKKSSLNLSLFTYFFICAYIISFISCQREIHCPDCNKKPPVAKAGPDQTITLPVNSVTLDGSSSKDPDGTITSFQWRKISGSDTFNLRSPNTAQTNVDSLKKGIYQFELKVTGNSGLSGLDTVKITVNDIVQPNRPPIANAGPDQTITLPTNSMNLDGSASSDPDNNIVSYLWTKISGPFSFNISNANAVKTQVTNLVEGVYQFELKVTDAEGLFDKDTVQIEIKPAIIQQHYNVCFYFPDPTGAIPCIWVSYDNPEPNLITVTINNLSDTISAFWCKDYSPTCPINTDYLIEPGVSCMTFNLPPGTYSWSAKNLICDISKFTYVTPELAQYFLSSHSTSGTITVNPGDSCIIQKIVFQ